MVVKRGRYKGKPRVIIYYRNSHEEQEASIERQQSTVEPYVAKHDWVIVARIEDRDISGSEVSKRPGLQRALAMIAAGEADGIVMDKFERMLRLDMIEMGALLSPIRAAGVWIESVNEGRFDFNSMSGRLTLGVKSEAQHAQLLSTSWNSLSQQVRMARDLGEAPLPKPCYGYRRVDDMDRPARKDGRRYGKWILHDLEASVIRQIFTWYAEGRSPGWICLELRRRAVRTQSGGSFWHRGSLRAILENEKYIGDAAYGKTSPGKYYHQDLGQVVETVGKPDKRRKPREQWIFSQGRVPKIIDREVWKQVQDRLARGRAGVVRDEDGNVLRREGEPPSPTMDRGEFLLSRLLVCGHCGAWMTGFLRPAGKRENAYVCARYMQHSKDGCVRCEVREEEAVRRLIQELRRLLSADRQEWLRGQLREQLQHNRRHDTLASLGKQKKGLESEALRLRKRLVSVSEDMIPEVEAAIRECRDQLAQTEASLKAAEDADPVRDLETAVDAAAKAIWRLEEAISGEHRPLLREALRGIVEKVTVRSAVYTTKAGKTRRKPGDIEVTLRRGTGLDLLASLGTVPHGSMPTITYSLAAC